MRALPTDGSTQPFAGLYLYRRSVPYEVIHGVVEPSFCVIAQGSKEVWLGESRYQYDADHYLLATADLPHVSQVLDASPMRPYLALRLPLAPALVRSVMTEVSPLPLLNQEDVRAMAVRPLEAPLLDTVVRIIRLLDAPDDAPILLPLISQEIIYRLLQDHHGKRLRHLVLQGGYRPDMAQAIERLQREFDQPLHIEHLAQELGMSVSGLHHHFKAVTALSPLQFQKRLRLQEARRLMLSEAIDATQAAYRVGYHNVSHFNREYKSLFGIPPLRDVQRLRGGTWEQVG